MMKLQTKLRTSYSDSLKVPLRRNFTFRFSPFFTQNNLPSCKMSFCPEKKKLKRFSSLTFRRSKSEILRPPLLESGSSWARYFHSGSYTCDVIYLTCDWQVSKTVDWLRNFYKDACAQCWPLTYCGDWKRSEKYSENKKCEIERPLNGIFSCCWFLLGQFVRIFAELAKK